ncbi:MAG: hypothetical protein HY886_06505 [Deltaproteobacteria bacterium]|nr:hypothetical protein [Deltaproteobacteria bacterium]
MSKTAFVYSDKFGSFYYGLDHPMRVKDVSAVCAGVAFLRTEVLPLAQRR